MRIVLLGAVVLVALAHPAIGADLRLYKAPAAAALWSWTGCFAGGHAGGLWNKDLKWVNRTPGGDFFGESLGGHDSGNWLAGGQAGCDYQFAGGFVLGVQGDYALTDAIGSHESAREFGVNYHSDAKSLASVTGRLGYAFDRGLGYVRAGGAWERDNYAASTIALGTVYTARDTRSGWTIGVGAEHAFTGFMSGFIEFDYYDFGTRRIALTPLLVGLRPAFVDVKESSSVVRAGVNIRFNGYAAR